MKHFPISMVALTVCLNSLAQVPETTVVERGPHHQVWQTVTIETDEVGNPISSTNVFVELATGLSYLNPTTSQWEESEAKFQVTADGHAVAAKGQHQVIIAQNINSGGSVDLFLPDGQRLLSNPMGLSFYDTSSGQSILLGEVKDCVGELVSPNVMVFADAFTDIRAALKYSYTKSGFSQDVILLEDAGIGSPSDYGLNPESTLLEMYSEFHSPPVPVKTTETTGDNLVDETLDFGQMQIGRGAAYVLNEEMESVPVVKTWTKVEGRDFLIESVPYASIKPLLERSGVSGQASRADRKAVDGRKGLVALAEMTPKSRVLKVANATPVRFSGKRGFILDYSTINTSQTNYVFKGDATYFISGNVSCFGTNTTFEGGTVLKYTNSVSLTVNTPVTWHGSSYRPVVLTARDDPSVGESITPTNALSGYYATTALFFDANAATNSLTLQNLRVTHAQTAVAINGRTNHVLSHVQLVNCANGISATNSDFSLRNALFHNVLTNFNGSTSTGRVEHLSADTATWLNKDIGTNLYLTNCLLVAVTNYGSFSSNSVSTASGGVFQSVGQGFHYLATGSSYRNAGTTAINGTLASQLAKLTTFPPIELTSDFTLSTTLSPQAQRDTDTPDLGYHYDPLDYVWGSRNLTNSSTLTLTNGVAVAVHGVQGTQMRNSTKFFSEGTPENLNRLVRYQTVQEQPVVWGTTSSSMYFFQLSASTLPELRLRFTDISLMANTTTRRAVVDSSAFTTLAWADCQLRGIYQSLNHQSSSQAIVAMTNNLTQRANLGFNQSYMGSSYPLVVYMYNNLFQGSTVSLTYSTNTWPWAVYDNLFDQVTLSQSGPATLPNSNNGYDTTTTKLPGSLGYDVTVTNVDYQIGPLGSYYYPTNGGNLSLLIDTGSRYVANAGLYHYTVKTAANTKEGTDAGAAVDIGYHYVSLDSANVALGQAATQSTTILGAEAARAVDGNTDGDYANGSVTHTDYNTTAWWHLELGQLRYIDTINVWNRTDCCADRLTDFYVFVSDVPFTSTNLTSTLSQAGVSNYHTSGTAGTPTTLRIARSEKYVRVQLGGTNYLSLAEVEVKAFLTDRPRDYDGDGLPDYFEDRDGDGTVDSGETDWQTSNNGTSGVPGLQTFTPLK
jgi:F5/8 type C domain-containing protein